MEPNSVLLVVALLAVAAGGIIATVRLRPVTLKIAAGLLAMTLSAAAGIAIVNDYYAYYQSWSQLSADLSGTYSTFNTNPVDPRAGFTPEHGRVEAVTLAGSRSHITRRALVYLPPQYAEPAYAHTDFPVVELVHGSPGTPQNWVVQMHVARVLDHLIGQHRMGPIIAVMPTMAIGDRFEECVDAPGALDDTYLTTDVRADIEARFRATTVPAEWGIAGYSSGGWCAADLALRHRALFGAAGIMDGYFRPTDGPAAAALHHDPAAEAANDPLLAARRLTPDTHPLPAFWLSVGTGDAGDLAGARAFVEALRGIDAAPLRTEAGATHNFTAWRAADPAMLAWMWTHLAAPALRVQFPVSGTVELGDGARKDVHPHRRGHRRPGVAQRSKASTIARSSPA